MPAQIHTATDGRDILHNDPDGWEVDQPWLWYEGPAGGDGTGGPFGHPPPGAEYGAPSMRGVSSAAVSRCLQLTADTVARMPWKTYRDRDRLTTPSWIVDPQATARDGRRTIGTTMVAPLSGVDFWAQHLRSTLIWGEGITYTPRVLDDEGQPTGPIIAPIYNLHPKHMGLDSIGWYPGDDETPEDEREYLDPRELIITRWTVPPGRRRGIGVIRAHAADLAFAANVRGWGDNVLTTGVPGGYLKSSKPDMNQAAADELRRRWEAAHGGLRKRIAVLNATTEFHPIELDPAAMQYIDLNRLSAWTICLIFGVPPSRLGINMGSPNTYANLESDNAVYVQDALMSIARKVEEAIDAVLPVGTTLKVDFNQMLRADTVTRFSAYETGIRAGFLTVDEVRSLEDLPPLPTTPTPAPAPVPVASDPAPVPITETETAA